MHQRDARKAREKLARANRRRQQQAIDALLETADSARSFDDVLYSARIQSLVADALWPFDEPAARNIFRRAWEAAIAADLAEQKATAQETPGVLAPLVTEARDEVLMRASRHPHLADAFLEELLAATSEEREQGQTESPQTQRRTPWREVSAGGSQRLALAYQLLQSDEFTRAADIVIPVLREGTSADLVTFLMRLRERNPALADAHFVRLLEVARVNRVDTDANAILLLSSYFISPQLLVIVDERGTLQFRSIARAVASYASTETTPVTPRVRAAFYHLAAEVLPRQSVMAADSTARFFAIERLLPFVEREEATAQFAPILRAARDALFDEIAAPRRSALTDQREVLSLAAKNPVDPLAPQLNKLAQTRGSAERDRLRMEIVKIASQRKLWQRARTIADEIEDTEARTAARSFIAVNQIANLSDSYAASDEDDFERAAAFVTTADAPPLAQAWGFAQAAELAARRNKRERATELISDAARSAARTEQNSRERVAAFVAVATVAARFDAPRAWELVAEVIQSINTAKDFAGDESSLEIASNASGRQDDPSELSISAEAFRPDELFATMARLDFPRALVDARAIRSAAPRAFATIAVARVALQQVNEGPRNRRRESAPAHNDQMKGRHG